MKTILGVEAEEERGSGTRRQNAEAERRGGSKSGGESAIGSGWLCIPIFYGCSQVTRP